MFALAQIMYISAFGFIPLNIMLGTILYAMCSLGKAHRRDFHLLKMANKFSDLNLNRLLKIYGPVHVYTRARIINKERGPKDSARALNFI